MTTSKTLYFIPGTMCDRRLWEKLWSAIEYEIDTCVKFVSLPISNANNIEQIVDDIAGCLEKQSDIIGFSLGGYLAAAIALKYPELVARIIILSNLPVEMEEKELLERKRAIQFITRHGYSGISEKRVFDLLAEQNRKHEHVKLIKAMDKELGQTTLLNQLLVTTTRQNLLFELIDRQHKLQFILGDQDTIWPLPRVSYYLNGLEGVSVNIIEGCGHMSPIERPKEVAKFIADFLSE